MEDLYDGLLKELECPICLTYMAPPIRQCETGHSICEPCRKKLPHCPLCQCQFTESRNISLEALASKMHYPCLYSKAGCTARLSLEQRENHELECRHKEYKCAYNKCTWSGRYEAILEHWTQKKSISKPYRDVNVCHTKIQKTDSFYVNIVQAYDSLFWYKFKSSGTKMFWSVQFIGPAERANNYYFEIELFKPGQPIRRILLGELCQPENIDNKDLFKAGFCVMTSLEAAGQFFGEDQLLIYYMRVKETSGVDSDGARAGSSGNSGDQQYQNHGRRGSNTRNGPADGNGRKHNFKGYQQHQPRRTAFKNKPDK